MQKFKLVKCFTLIGFKGEWTNLFIFSYLSFSPIVNILNVDKILTFEISDFWEAKMAKAGANKFNEYLCVNHTVDIPLMLNSFERDDLNIMQSWNDSKC